MYPYSEGTLGFGFDSDHPAQEILARNLKRGKAEDEAIKKAAHDKDDKPNKVTKNVNETPVNVTINLDPSSVVGMMQAKSMVRDMDSDKATMLTNTINNARARNKFDSPEALASMLHELSPSELAVVKRHIEMGIKEAKNHKEEY